MTSFKFLYNFLIIAVAAALTCNTTDPPVDKAQLLLKLKDVSCTEAWITLTTNNLQLPAEINITRTDGGGNSLSHISVLNTQDSLLYIDSLLPNQTYLLKAASTEYGVVSSELSVTTMDTTSHNFTFETWTFGDIGSSTLYDVAIISPENIWAVGEINIADTSVNGYTIYNAVHWNGSEWTLHRIMFYTICGQPSSQNAYPASSIIAFSEDEIWVAQRGDQIIKIENGIQKQAICMPWTFSINKIWGTSSSNLYVVGNNGNIAHYNGSQWTRIESGTDVNINDIWGYYDQINNRKKIFCAVSFVFQLGDHKILTIDNNNKVDSLPWNTGRRVQSVWSNNGRIVYTSGGGVFNNKSGNWKEETTVPLYYTNKIRGRGLNDIIVGGDFGLLAHYNGSGWKVFGEFQHLPSASFYSVAIKENIVVSVGFTSGKSLIVMGRRN